MTTKNRQGENSINSSKISTSGESSEKKEGKKSQKKKGETEKTEGKEQEPKPEKRFGRQEPTLSFILPYTETKGQEAVEIYELSGRTARPWQVALCYDVMAVGDDGLWTHSYFGLEVPRQNGKNEVVTIRELYALKNGERALHTAHRTKTSTAAFTRLCAILEKAGIHEIKGKNRSGYKAGKSKGQEFIQFSEDQGGGIVEFRTRSTTGGLGESYDLLVIDEAQEFTKDQESALKYTIAASENPQTIYTGTPPTPYSGGTVFVKFRKDTLRGDKKYSGWAEWSVDKMTDPHDIDAWYETNPSLGYGLTERVIESEIDEDDSDDFNIQRLGFWILYNQKSEITEAEWDALEVSKIPAFVGKLFVGIKYNIDGATVAMSVSAKTADGKVFAECLSCKSVRDGNLWIVSFLKKMQAKIGKVVIDGKSGQEILVDELKDAKFKKYIIPKTAEFAKANSLFVAELNAKTICHANQPGVKNIISNCERRAVGGGGGFGFKSIKNNADIAIMDSLILAIWAAREFKEKEKQKSYA